ncbi:hypothetical protein [Candidatus Borreliella tachyglossi]|uniref:hypothetical protein n=1 Tax=Candidatus Borreliella tachyglossi TaxID=1964448 RepID=UPI0040416BA7
MKGNCKFFLSLLFVLYSCNFDGASKYFLSLEEAITLEIAGYEYLGGNKVKTRVHTKNYFDSVKDINSYSYNFILDKAENRVVMQIILCSKIASLLDYKSGFIFDFGFKLSFLNVSFDSFEFKVKEIFKREVALKPHVDMGDNRLESAYTLSLDHIREINHEFEVRNHRDDINSSTSELMYFMGTSESSVLKESYIVLYYYVFKAIERFMQ